MELVSGAVYGAAHAPAPGPVVQAGRPSLMNSMETQKELRMPALLLAAILPGMGAGASDLDRLISCFETRPFDPEPAGQATSIAR